MLRKTTCALLFSCLAAMGPARVSAITINFDDQSISGPTTFADAGPAQSLDIDTDFGNVKFEGGVVLSQTLGLPVNQTSIYGTGTSGDPSLTNPLTITFEQPINNFFLDVISGPFEPTVYTVADNTGNSSSFSLEPNTRGGQSQIGFEAAGTQVTLTSALPADGNFLFAIDNITFNEDLPDDLPSPVPESSTILGSALMLGSLILLRRKRSQQTEGSCT